MSTVKQFPESIIGRQKAMTVAKTKKDAVPADNILSTTTSDRLDIGEAAYTAGRAAIATTRRAYHSAVVLARPQRLLLFNEVTNFHVRLNYLIKIGKVPASARAYFELDISNKKMPNMNTDADLLAAAAMVLSGDILRRAAGGIAMTEPTIAEFTVIYNAAKPIIIAVSTAHTAINTAVENLKNQIPEIDDLIKHIWSDAEGHYSKSTALARRVQCRLWGVRYVSKGVASLISGVCTNSTTHAMLANVQLYLVGVGRRVMSDADGNYIFNTILFEDLTLIAKLAGYEDFTIDFVKEDGVSLVLNIMMVKKIII